MRNVKDQILTQLVDINNEINPITVYNNYIEVLDRMENMQRNNDK